jgi:hypothetical protein
MQPQGEAHESAVRRLLHIGNAKIRRASKTDRSTHFLFSLSFCERGSDAPGSDFVDQG